MTFTSANLPSFTWRLWPTFGVFVFVSSIAPLCVRAGLGLKGLRGGMVTFFFQKKKPKHIADIVVYISHKSA